MRNALRWAELIVTGWLPSEIAVTYLAWRLRTNRMKPVFRSEMLTTLAVAARESGALAQSEDAAREAIRLWPHDAWSYVELATTLEASGRVTEARETLQALVARSDLDRRFIDRVHREITRLSNPHA